MSIIRCVDCGEMYENMLYEGRCPHRMRMDRPEPLPPVTVTLSGNSTPLLPGCGECAALRARLAEAERIIRGDETNSDRDGPLAVLMVASMHVGEGPCSIHKSHLLDTLARMSRFKKKLAEAEARAKPTLPPEVVKALEDFEREMQDKTIPEIIQETKRRDRLAAEARQRLMGEVGTEQALHHAWRKRAEEAEDRAGRAEEAVRVLAELYKSYRMCNMHTRSMDEHDDDLTRFIAAEKAVEQNPAARAAVEGAR